MKIGVIGAGAAGLIAGAFAAKVSFYRNGYIYLHTMKENADGVLDIDEVIDSKNF